MDLYRLYWIINHGSQVGPDRSVEVPFLFRRPATLTPIIVAALVRFVAQLLIRRAHRTVHILARCPRRLPSGKLNIAIENGHL